MADEDKKQSEEVSENDEDVVFEEEDGEGEQKSTANKLKELRAKLRVCQEEKQEYLTGWQRARADYANYKKEEEVRQKKVADNAKRNVLLDMISVMDSFDMAFANSEAWERVDETWRMGIEHIYSQFQQVLSQYGVSAIDAVRVPFDPALHESMDVVETEKKEDDGTVATVLKRGYKLNDEVIRPARVNVYTYKDK